MALTNRGLCKVAIVILASLASAGASARPVVPQETAGAASTAAQGPATGGAESGKLAWYGRKFAGRRTASGERFDPNALTMAHKTLPFGTRVQVTNVANDRSVVVRVTDRGPTQPDRIGDVSLAAARQLGMLRSGVIEARLEVVQ